MNRFFFFSQKNDENIEKNKREILIFLIFQFFTFGKFSFLKFYWKKYEKGYFLFLKMS